MHMKTSYTVKVLKPYSMKELCTIYQVGYKTMRRWLQPFEHEIGKRQGRIYNVSQVTVIFKHLGVPSVLEG